MTLLLRQLPAPLHTLAPASDAPGAMPGRRPRWVPLGPPSALPTAMPETWVPCPLSSNDGPVAQLPTSLLPAPLVVRPGSTARQFTKSEAASLAGCVPAPHVRQSWSFRSGWRPSMPLSATPTVTPLPVMPSSHSLSAPTSAVPRLACGE